MKKIFKRFNESGLFMFVVMLLCTLVGVSDGSMLAAAAIKPPAAGATAVKPPNGGAVEIGDPLTATDTRENSEDLILDTIDQNVTVIRPTDTIVDTVSRHISDVKVSDNVVIRHYAIDVIDLSTTVSVAYEYSATVYEAPISLTKQDIIANEQTLILPGVKGYKADGVTLDPIRPLMLYVVGFEGDGRPRVTAVNGRAGSDPSRTGRYIPDLAVNKKVIRGGRAGSETQIQTDPYSGVPTDFEQFLQKFIAQVELSEIFQRADKEVDWTFTDAEQEAIYDMKRTQNTSFLLGVKGRIRSKNAHTAKAEDIYTTDGIWYQAGKQYDMDGMTIPELIGLYRAAFTGNSSGKRKIFIVGSEILEQLENIEFDKTVYVGNREKAFGLEFSTLVSKFGTLLIAHDQSFDDMEMSNCGFILDPDFLRKWTMGWRVNNFDFRKSGQSDSDGRSLMEICGLVLKNPNAHVRVTVPSVTPEP
jgi:hypothetical protein